jgi:hypothetical protein
MGHELGKFIADWTFGFIRGHWAEKIGRRLLLCELPTAWKPPRMVEGNEEQVKDEVHLNIERYQHGHYVTWFSRGVVSAVVQISVLAVGVPC